MTVGKRLIEFRKSKSMTQLDFAKTIGMSAAAYKNYELDQRKVPINILDELHEVYQIDLEWLITGKNSTINTAEKEMLETIIITVKNLLLKSKLRIPPAKEALLIVALYTHYLQLGVLDEQTYDDLFKLVK